MDNDNQGSIAAAFPRKEYYDFSNKIMVAAIVGLSIVIYFICLLHLYARVVLSRRQRSRASAQALALRAALARLDQPEPPKVGLDPSAISALPLFVYQVRENGDGVEGHRNEHRHEVVMECSVCLSMFEDGDTARVLPNCKHSFHAECIDKWLCSNTTCPVCRAGAMPRLRLEPREPPVRSGPVEMVTIRTVKPGHSASSSWVEGTSDVPSLTTSGKAVTGGGSSARFGPFRRILSWERQSPRTQNSGHEDGTEHDIENQ